MPSSTTVTIPMGSSSVVFYVTPNTTSGNRSISITTSPVTTYSGTPISYDAVVSTVTLTGPPSGIINQASTVFTVTLNAPVAVDVIVTPISSVSTDTFES